MKQWKGFELTLGLRCAKLARTISDLEGGADIQTHHLSEAIQYRPRRQV